MTAQDAIEDTIENVIEETHEDTVKAIGSADGDTFEESVGT